MNRATVCPAGTDLTTALNDVIDELRTDRGLSQSELGRRLWIGRTNINYRLRGKVAWTFPELLAVAEVLGIKASELLRLTEQHARRSRRTTNPSKENL